MLHVEEVGRQGTLRRIRIMSALLPLLLLLNSGNKLRDRQNELGGGIIKASENVGLGVLSRGLAEQQVGLANVVIGEGAEQLQDGGETTDSLKTC